MKKSNQNKISKLLTRFQDLERELDELGADLTIDNIIEEEQAIFDDKSEKWKESEKGGNVQENLNRLERAKDAFDNMMSELSDLTTELEDIEANLE